MWLSLRNFLLKPRTLLGIYILVAVAASIPLVLIGTHLYSGKTPAYFGYYYTDYNNYLIFRQSFFHLAAGKNLYVIYPPEYCDLYKYSPTFAMFMGMFAWLPDMAGVIAWNLLNAIALFLAIRMLPFKSRTQSLLLWFVLLELLTSLQNAQSNGLMAGLLIAAYAHMQKGKPQWATLWLVLATFIKVYGAVGFCLFLFYPGKIRFIAYAAMWTLALLLAPLLITTPHALIDQYRNWALMMAEDQSTSYGLSVMGWLHSWFGIDRGKAVVTITGIALFLIPFLRWKLYRNELYKLMILSAMMIWVIIFNHKAESPTFIIAVAGIGIWYFIRPRNMWRDVLLAIVFIFTCLSPTDLFPPYIRQHFFQPYAIKAIPCILAWCVVTFEILTMKKDDQLSLAG